MQELENLNKVAVFTAWVLIMVLGVCISFIMGVTMAYYLDQAEQKLPDVWAGEVKKLDGYNQIPHRYDEQPAYNIVELEPLQTL